MSEINKPALLLLAVVLLAAVAYRVFGEDINGPVIEYRRTPVVHGAVGI